MIPKGDTIKKAIDYILANEGGFVDIPEDRGGPTNFGITISDLSAWRKTAVTEYDVKTMSQAEAANIYWYFYLKPLYIDQLTSGPIAIAIADAGVLYGVSTSAKFAQRVCADHGFNIAVDGHMGPLTVAALDQISDADFLKDFHTFILERIGDVIEANPYQEKFKVGWTNRADKLLTLA